MRTNPSVRLVFFVCRGTDVWFFFFFFEIFNSWPLVRFVGPFVSPWFITTWWSQHYISLVTTKVMHRRAWPVSIVSGVHSVWLVLAIMYNVWFIMFISTIFQQYSCTVAYSAWSITCPMCDVAAGSGGCRLRQAPATCGVCNAWVRQCNPTSVILSYWGRPINIVLWL